MPCVACRYDTVLKRKGLAFLGLVFSHFCATPTAASDPSVRPRARQYAGNPCDWCNRCAYSSTRSHALERLIPKRHQCAGSASQEVQKRQLRQLHSQVCRSLLAPPTLQQHSPCHHHQPPRSRCSADDVPQRSLSVSLPDIALLCICVGRTVGLRIPVDRFSLYQHRHTLFPFQQLISLTKFSCVLI